MVVEKDVKKTNMNLIDVMFMSPSTKIIISTEFATLYAARR